MDSSQVASVLRREKEILEEMLDLAECQPDLLDLDRADDLEILLSFRVDALSQLATAEDIVDAEMYEKFDSTSLRTEDLRQIYDLNVAILNLVDRIVNADEKTRWLLEHSTEPTR